MPKVPKICSKSKSNLAKSTSFNEVVMLDYRQFSRFMVGKLINNERVDTIIQTKLEFWCMSLGFPTSRLLRIMEESFQMSSWMSLQVSQG